MPKMHFVNLKRGHNIANTSNPVRKEISCSLRTKLTRNKSESIGVSDELLLLIKADDILSGSISGFSSCSRTRQTENDRSFQQRTKRSTSVTTNFGQPTPWFSKKGSSTVSCNNVNP
eukprot:m.302054 g.302054  ORF g.302054 m.302054 type:complete len:117 (-) comp16433_c0_seq1:1926-2276(-)